MLAKINHLQTSNKIIMFILQVSVAFPQNHFLENEKHKSPSCGNVLIVLPENEYTMLTLHTDTLKYVLMTFSLQCENIY